LRQLPPVAYQQSGEIRRSLQARYRLDPERQVHFEVQGYDGNDVLIIDPVLEYSTYFGGSGNETLAGIAVDAAGSAYVCGGSNSPEFGIPVLPNPTGPEPNYFMYVMKLRPDGSSPVYTTYFQTFRPYGCSGIAVDTQGNVYIAGKADPSNLYVPPNAYRSSGPGYAAKLTSDGSAFSYLTYVDEVPRALAVDPAGNLCLTGLTSNLTLTATPGAFQVPLGTGKPRGIWILRLNTTGSSAIYSTVIAGGEPESIAVDPIGNVVVAGAAYDINFPTTPNAAQSTHTPIGPPPFPELPTDVYDAFVLKLSATGSQLLYGTFLGGVGDDRATTSATNVAGDIWVGGYSGGNMPMVGPGIGALCCSFLARISAAGPLVYSIAIGSGLPQLKVDEQSNTFVTTAARPDYPITADALQPTPEYYFAGNPIAATGSVLAKIDPTGSMLLYSTFLGGILVQGLSLDSFGDVYFGGVNFGSSAYDLPRTPGSYQVQPGGRNDVIIGKVNMSGPSCTFTVEGNFPSTIAYGGGSVTLTVKAPAGCIWTTAKSGTAGVSFSSPIGIGSGLITVTVAPNRGSFPLQGTVSVTGATFTFRQDVSPCTYRTSPANYYFESWGGPGAAQILTQQGCVWNVSLSSQGDPSVVITSGTSGIGPGAFTFFARPGARATLLIGDNSAQVYFDVYSLGLNIYSPDLIGTGNASLVWQDPRSGLGQVWSVSTSNPPSVRGTIDLSASQGWTIAGIADLNEDGEPDIVWQHATTGESQVWYMRGQKLLGADTISGPNPWRIVAVRSFGGHPSLLWQDPQTGAAEIWFMYWNQIVASKSISAGNSWRIAATADFNNDGCTDILWQSPITGQSQLWLMGTCDSGPVVTEAVPFSDANEWRIVSAADFNQDGHVDVVWQSATTGEAQIWYLGGLGGTTINAVAPLSAANPWRIAAPR
jgi:hypothetical protein